MKRIHLILLTSPFYETGMTQSSKSADFRHVSLLDELESAAALCLANPVATNLLCKHQSALQSVLKYSGGTKLVQIRVNKEFSQTILLVS